MYGMINLALKEWVERNHGADRWTPIAAAAGLPDEEFISDWPYPDQVTYRLIEHSAEQLSLDPNVVLFEFGKHWILHTARMGYGPILDANGTTLGTFLDGLPKLHDRIALVHPKLQPPTFRVEWLAENHALLHHITHRPGLTCFVEGLLHGLSSRFHCSLRVTRRSEVSHGAPHDVFEVQWTEATPGGSPQGNPEMGSDEDVRGPKCDAQPI